MTYERIPITRPYMPDEKSFMELAKKIWETRWLTHGGPLTEKLQKALCERLKVPYAIVYANGHLALDCALKALGLQDGEAITTPFTYISTANALFMNGLKPVFCDIKESDCTIDERKIESLITVRTKVIVPVHVYGFPSNDQEIQRIAKKYGLKVVYDAAHAFGVEVDGHGIGSWGDASMFSFQATKVFHTVEGGAVTFSDPAQKERLISSKNFGMVADEEADSISFNAKMTELCAAMGLANLKILDGQIAKRKDLIEHYLERLQSMDIFRLFSWDNPKIQYNYAYFPIRINENKNVTRDELATRLLEDYNIQVRKYFYPLLSDFNCYKREHNSLDTPIAKRISNEVMTLPLFVDLTHKQVDFICDAIEHIITRRIGHSS